MRVCGCGLCFSLSSKCLLRALRSCGRDRASACSGTVARQPLQRPAESLRSSGLTEPRDPAPLSGEVVAGRPLEDRRLPGRGRCESGAPLATSVKCQSQSGSRCCELTGWLPQEGQRAPARQVGTPERHLGPKAFRPEEKPAASAAACSMGDGPRLMRDLSRLVLIDGHVLRRSWPRQSCLPP